MDLCDPHSKQIKIENSKYLKWSDNDKNFESLEKNSLDLYSSFKSIYLQDRENKIRNSIEDEDEWGELNN